MEEKCSHPNEAMQPMATPRRNRDQYQGSRERIRELMQIAESIAAIVEGQTRPHERCKLRRMVEMFVSDDGPQCDR